MPSAVASESDPPRVHAAPADRALAVGAVVVILAGIGTAVWMMHPPRAHRWSLIDLDVYRAAGRALWHHRSLYGPYVAEQLVVPLPFIYPPFAAILALPATALPGAGAAIAWTALTVLLLAYVVRRCFAPAIEAHGPIAWFLATAAMLALTPVQEHLRFGQVGIPLLACVVADCLGPRRRPTGALTGLAAAVKLVPGLFVPYLLLTGRRRAAATAVGVFALAATLGTVVAPADSERFWTDRVFTPTSPGFFSNQSLQGMLIRSIAPWRPVWIVTVLVTGAFGLAAATFASRSGDERRGVALVALTAALVSPISWIHHLVWLIPAFGVLTERVRTRRAAVGLTALALFCSARVPYLGHDFLGPGAFGALVTDAYGFVTLGLLVYLGDPVTTARGLRRTLTSRHPGSAAAGEAIDTTTP